MTPSSLKDGLSLASTATVDVGPHALVDVERRAVGVDGTICRVKAPEPIAAAAFWCDVTENSSSCRARTPTARR